jgi:hypothetical protein
MATQRDRVNQAGLGLQQRLTLVSVPDGAQEQYLGRSIVGLVLNVAGDYEAELDTSGLGSLEVHLKPAAVGGGAVVPSLYATYADGTTLKLVSTPAGLAFGGGVLRTYAFTLKGESKVVVAFTLAPGDSLDFSGSSLAEANGR